jgi:hypothetical protein
MAGLDAGRGLFSISVASELTGVNPQMLRVYEQKGLLAPHRTEGGTRRYSGQDLERIDEITSLLSDGLNLRSGHRSPPSGVRSPTSSPPTRRSWSCTGRGPPPTAPPPTS